MRSISWLNNVKQTLCGRPVRTNRLQKNHRLLPQQLEQLEVRSFPSATVMQVAADSAQSQWATLSDAERFDEFAQQLAEHVNQFSDDAAELGKVFNDLPLSGDELAKALSSLASSAFELDLPESGIQSYLQSHGFRVDSLATAQDVIDGTSADWLVLTYLTTVEPNSPVHLTGTGRIGSENGIRLDLRGELTANPQLTLAVTFGLDHNGQFFIQEGSQAGLKLTIDGILDGTAVIPKLVDVDIHASAADKHLVDAQVDLIFSDFDEIANERLYLTGEGGLSIDEMLKHDDAVNFHGSLNLDAELSVASPVNQLPEFLRTTLAGILPNEMSWSAGVSYDLATQEFSYSIDNTSLTQLVELYQRYDNIEDAVFQVLVDQISEHNPIPESIQNVLAYKVPILDMNLMDLMEIPKALQFMITPEAFRDHGTSKLESNEKGNILDFQLDLFELNDEGRPDNLIRMLNGEDYNIFSVDVDQTFKKDLTTITLMPETILATYFGIVNVTAQVDLIPQMHLAMQMTLGLDSRGFYTIGEATDARGELIDKSAEPDLKFGVGVTGRIIGEADLLLALDFARVTVDVGVSASAGFIFKSPNDDLKLRAAEVVNPNNIVPVVTIDLNLGMKGEIGILAAKELTRSVEQTQTMELYRLNKEGATLADLEAKLKSFKEKLNDEGRQVIFIGAAAGEPHCLAAATVLLYQELRSYGPVAKTMVNDLNVQVADVAKSLHTNLKASLADVAKTLHDDLKQEIGDIAKTLKNELGKELTDVAKALRDGLKAGYMDVAKALRFQLKAEIGDVVTEVTRYFSLNSTQLADMLKELGARIEDIAQFVGQKFGLTEAAVILRRLNVEWNEIARQMTAFTKDPEVLARILRDSLTDNVDRIAEALKSVKLFGTSSMAEGLRAVTDNMAAIARGLRNHVTDDISRIARALSDLKGSSPNGVAEGLKHLKANAEEIAVLLNRWKTSNLNEIAVALDRVGFNARHVASGLGTISGNFGRIASALRDNNITRSLEATADAIGRGIRSSSWTDVASGLKALTRDANRISNALKSVGVAPTDIANALSRVGGLSNAKSVVESLVGKKNLKKFGF